MPYFTFCLRWLLAILARLEDALQPALRSMQAQGINTVASHRDMMQQQPRILFLNDGGKGKAVDLANGIREALDAQANLRK
jgi:hypothetical protein